MNETDDEIYIPRAPLALPELIRSCAPVDGVIHAYLWWVVPTTHAPAQYHLGAILPVLAYEAARRGILVSTQRRLPRVWTGLVGASGHGKSTAHYRAIQFARDWYGIYLAGNYRDPFFHLDGSMPGILAASSTGWMPDLNASIGIYETDEMSKILAQLDSVSETLCKVFDGVTVTRHLRQFQQAKAAGERVPDQLVNPAFSACFASTPSSLERVTHAYHLEGGLYSRILWFRGELAAEDLRPREVHRDRARATVLRLWEDWARWMDAEMLTREGERRRVSVPQDICDLIDRHLFEPSRAVLARGDDRVNPARLRGLQYCEMLSGLYALSRGDFVADEDDAAAAINLVNACIGTLSFLDRTIAVNDVTRLREKALAAVRAAGLEGLRRSELYPVLKCTKRELEEVVQTLLDADAIEEIVRSGKGRPLTVYLARGYPAPS